MTPTVRIVILGAGLLAKVVKVEQAGLLPWIGLHLLFLFMLIEGLLLLLSNLFPHAVHLLRGVLTTKVVHIKQIFIT